jgi:hypothetical protein
MKLFAKIAIAVAVGGSGATALYADPGHWLDANGGSSGASAMPASNLAELLAKANATGEQIRGDYLHVLHLQQLARKQKDIIRLNCINDKLVQIKPHMNIEERDAQELQGGVVSGGIVEEIRISGENVHYLREQADQCAGEPSLSTEQTNSWTHPTAPDDPFQKPWDTIIEPPAYASPFS